MSGGEGGRGARTAEAEEQMISRRTGDFGWTLVDGLATLQYVGKCKDRMNEVFVYERTIVIFRDNVVLFIVGNRGLTPCPTVPHTKIRT